MVRQRGKARFTRALATLVGLGCATVVVADVVVLKEGSRIHGTVERLANGKLLIKTDFAGALEIDAALVETIETDRPLVVGLESRATELQAPEVLHVPQSWRRTGIQPRGRFLLFVLFCQARTEPADSRCRF